MQFWRRVYRQPTPSGEILIPLLPGGKGAPAGYILMDATSKAGWPLRVRARRLANGIARSIFHIYDAAESTFVE